MDITIVFIQYGCTLWLESSASYSVALSIAAWVTPCTRILMFPHSSSKRGYTGVYLYETAIRKFIESTIRENTKITSQRNRKNSEENVKKIYRPL